MKDYGKVLSTIQPEKITIDEYSVWVNSNIKVLENDLFKGFEYNMIQYDKDEFILIQSKKNTELESQITNTQLALTEVYEMLNN